MPVEAIKLQSVIPDPDGARRAKLNRVAKDIRNAVQLADILASFDPEIRTELLDEIRPKLKFTV